MYLKYLLNEKSTQYYYFSDEMLGIIRQHKDIADFVKDWTGSEQDLENEIRSEFQQYFTEAEEPKKKENIKVELDDNDLVPGTLVLIHGYGTDSEPRKYMWNASRGEILSRNHDGSYKVRITDVKDSNVLYSKKWYDQEQKALRQRVNLKRDEFKTLKEIDNQTAQVEIDKENDAIDKAREVEIKTKEKEKADTEKLKKEQTKAESIRRMSRKLI